MKKLITVSGDTAHLPKCQIRTKYSELELFIRAILDGVVEFSELPEPNMIIEDSGESILLSNLYGMSISVERPFSPEVLTDAVKRLLSSDTSVQFSADAENRLAILGDSFVSLTETEFRLYSAILKNSGDFISAKELSMSVWGRYDRNLCTVYISYLRRKLDSAFGDGTLITASKKGYRLRDPS
ncbi:MAG: winged helix-turn-helix transcriptional regulator [Ruminococcaceae bacterium]|nr:winged helix-turn-helix transcriptional regulator [Oscillospiraceae bacterium]